ncbi:LysM peptidoglycan-binding domain-containing protein [Neorhizobium tomejilense]|uniref:LysM peptidoglycan-binding domain-containing protein n=1 Tax=Neorhizobium tomejilense TaxID=2093828 RepID=UPI003ECCE662
MMKNRAGWLALIVLAIASLLMVFLVMPAINKDSKPIGDAINAAGNAVKDAVTEPQPTARAPDAAKPADQAAATAPQTAQPAASSAAGQAAAMTPPSFDVLRVEPDGSTVIAGRAAPHSKLEVTDGTAIVAKVDVGPSGDFAAILDKPLPPGDHQLVLKAIGKDGKTILSEETATVSVPADKNGKLLAMVTKPGKASRLIATPDAATSPGTSAAQPAAQAAAASPATNQAPASPALAAPSANTSVVALPAPPAGSSNLASSAPSIPVSAPASPAATSAAPELRVTAVEIEGNKIFVAGNTKAGTLLRGQADGRPIGTAQAGQDGSFVIEGAIDLAVGDHRIGVEVVGAGGQALVRVEVPFNRPAGDQVAAVAAPQAANNGMSAADSGAFDKLRNETVRAFNLLRGLYDNGRVPSAEQMAAARSATSIALKSLSEYRLPADAAASARVLAETTVQNAAAAVAALDALPKDVASVGAGLKRIGEMIARAVGPTIARELQGVQATTAAPMTVTDASGTRTIQQEPLTQSERSSVIIRRGDTLWQISRRVYGQGVRYTTIYLANEAQIRNPDVIQPGQIFGVPDAALPDAEELHRQRMIQRRS